MSCTFLGGSRGHPRPSGAKLVDLGVGGGWWGMVGYGGGGMYALMFPVIIVEAAVLVRMTTPKKRVVRRMFSGALPSQWTLRHILDHR